MNKSKKILTVLCVLTIVMPFLKSQDEKAVNAASWWNSSMETKNACQYLVRDLGYTKYAAAGILGNFRHESNVNPYVRERIGNHSYYPLGTWLADQLDPDNNGFGPGWGIAQWGDGSGRGGLGSGRWIQLLNYVNGRYGTSYSASYNDSFRYGQMDNEASVRANIPNIYQQLDFVKYEMRDGSGYVSQKELNRMTSIDATSDAVLYRYEIAATKTQDSRRKNAYDIYYNECSSVVGDNFLFSRGGFIDKFDVEDHNLVIKGWHASENVNSQNLRYMFIMDALTGKELKRLKIINEERTDVANAFPTVASTRTSGFNVSIPITKELKNKKVYIVTRYSPGSDENEVLDDMWFREKTIDIPDPDYQNKGAVEKIIPDGKNLIIRGWHMNSNATEQTQRYMFIMDAITGKELKRLKITNESRPDIAKLYPEVSNAQLSGFNVTIPLTDDMSGKKVYVITRYSPGTDENEILGDMWFRGNTADIPNVQQQNRGYLDKLVVEGSTLNVKGWHTTTNASEQNLRYMFLMDADTGKEVKRLKITNENRVDVAQIFSDISSAKTSGFNMSIPLTNDIRGKRLYVVTRYSPNNDENEVLADMWFRGSVIQIPNVQQQNRGYMDVLTADNNNLTVKGWHTSTETTEQNLRYMFIMDAATGKELKRVKIMNENRSDVARIFSDIPSAKTSGFNMTIPLTSELRGKKIYVVTRYSPNNDENEVLADMWFRGSVVQIPDVQIQNRGYMDVLATDGNNLVVKGWHVSSKATAQTQRYMFVMDATTGKELKRVKMVNENRSDVANVFPGVPTAQTSGFNVNIPLTNDIKGKKVYIITRYIMSVGVDKTLDEFRFIGDNITLPN